MNFRRYIKRFGRSEDGSILVMVAVSLAVFIGFIALSFDLGRVAVTQTELQSYADHVALAAAGELDGEANAIERAEIAADTLIRDTQTFGADGADLDGDTQYTLRFLKSLPALDTDPIGIEHETDVDSLAQYVEVTIDSRNVQMAFGAAVLALTGNGVADADVAATAVAGYTLYACDITPLMFCVPPGFDAESEVGTMIELVAGPSNNTPWGPGNFGFLSPRGSATVDPAGPCAGLNNNQLDRCLFAAERGVSSCFAQRGVDLSTGLQQGSMAAAFNVRFDIYESTMLSFRNNPSYNPAPNTISGNRVYIQGGSAANPQCKVDPSTDTVPLPLDDCFISIAGCDGGRFGDGDFSDGLDGDYPVDGTFPTDPAVLPKAYLKNYVADPLTETAPSWFPSNPATRYDIYKAEITNSGGGDILIDRDETGRAICSSNPSTDPERRVIIAAGIDCNANAINGSKDDVPVKEFIEIFLPRPGLPDIYVEILGSAEEQGSGKVRPMVELFR